MKTVQMFQTEDGKTFKTKEAAMDHEFELSIRGVIQSHIRTPSLTPIEIGEIIRKKQDEVFELIGKYRRSKASSKAATTRLIKA